MTSSLVCAITVPQVSSSQLNVIIFYQVDVAGGYKETEKLIDELMNMKIPQYKPSSNHVQLSDTGIHIIISSNRNSKLDEAC